MCRVTAPAEAAQRGAAITPPALGLLCVFALAKLLVLFAAPVAWSPWMPIAWLWQDAAVLLAFMLLEKLLRWRPFVWSVYGLLVFLSALSLPVTLVLGSPLTASVLRAARGTLSDSILHHATPANVMAFAVLLATGLLVPLLLSKRVQSAATGKLPHAAAGIGRLRKSAAVTALVCIVLITLGPGASARVDTRGLERNPVFSITRTLLPRIRGEERNSDWRTPIGGTAQGDGAPLHHLRGSARGRNVLMIVLESTGAQYLRPFGGDGDPMPNLTRLAERAILFENAYAVYPESIKGLVSFLSSRYPAFDVSNASHAAVALPSLASELAASGYATAVFHSGRFAYLGMHEVVSAMQFHSQEDAGDIGGNRESSFGVEEAATVRRILGWIDSLPRQRPFFAVYLPVAGHHPYTYQTPGPFPVDTELNRYRNALFDGDRSVGSLLRGLQERSLDSSTVVVVFSDHSEAFGQHEGNTGHTFSIYDENVRVPFMLALPNAQSGARDGRVVSLLDVAPTLLDVLGARIPAEFQGRSLLRPGAQMSLFFTDYSLGLLGARDGCTKIIHELESRRTRMFDLCADPGEQQAFAPVPARATEYVTRLKQWSAAQRHAVLNHARRR